MTALGSIRRSLEGDHITIGEAWEGSRMVNRVASAAESHKNQYPDREAAIITWQGDWIFFNSRGLGAKDRP